MSYCRFGDSDAYIFLSNQGLECCGCIRATRIPLISPYVDFFGHTHTEAREPVCFDTAQQMLDHIAMHRNLGDHVSLDVDERIRKDYPDLNESVVEKK